MAVSSTIKLRFDGAAVQKGLASIKKGFAELASAGTSAFKSLFSPVAKLAALLGPAAVGAGMVKLAKDSSEAAANFENMKSQFELFTGSVAASQSLIEELRKIAVESPLELVDITDGARMLLTYGVAAKDTAKIIEQLSEVSAGSAERFGRISYAFGQIHSIGRLMGTELKQLTEAGFNPLEYISKRTGETMIQLKGRMEDGKIAIHEVKAALAAATSEGGRFHGLNEKMAQTFSGRVSMMRDQWGRLMVDLGTGINAGMKVAVDAIAASLPQLSEKFKLIGGIIGPAIADAVNGDYERLADIGRFIGEAIKVGLATSLEQASAELWKGLLKTGSSDTALDKWINEKIDGGFMDLSTRLRVNTRTSKLPELAEKMKSGARIASDTAPGYRMANEGERSTFTDETGRRLIKVLEGVVPDTKGKFRYAKEDEQTTFRDATGNKIVEILTTINRSLAPQP